MGQIADFHAAHGPEYIADEKGWLYFPDGAARENSSYGIMIGPPTDPHERAKCVRDYWTLKLRRAVHEFDQLKNVLQMSADAAAMNGRSYPPDEKALAELEKLREQVERTRSKQAAAEAAVEETIPARVREYRAKREKCRADGAEFAAKVRRITV